MRIISLILALISPTFLPAQLNFGYLYPTTAGFTAQTLIDRGYEFRVHALKTDASSQLIKRIDMEVGADGTYWGYADLDYPAPAGAGTRMSIDKAGDYVTVEAQPMGAQGQNLRMNIYQANGFLVSQINRAYPQALDMQIDQLIALGSYFFVAGSYHHFNAPQNPVPVLLKGSYSGVVEWETLFNPAGFSYTVNHLIPASGGGCYWVHTVDGTDRYLEAFDGAGHSKWRHAVGGPLSVITAPAEAPDKSCWIAAYDDPIPSAGGNAGRLLHFDTNGVLLLDLPLNPLLNAHSVSPRLVLPGPSGAIVTGNAGKQLGFPESAFAAQISPDGTLLWAKNYYFFAAPPAWIAGVNTADGGVAFTGNSSDKLFLLKIGPDGSAAAADYCTSVGDFPWHEWIGHIGLGTLDNYSEKWFYTDFGPALPPVDLVTGETTPFSLTAGFSWETFDEYCSVWIDLNRNGIFDDPGERLYNGMLQRPPNGTPQATLDGTLTIPENTSPGLARMRVSMQRGAYPGSCGTLPFGETEDYLVNITGNQPFTEFRSGKTGSSCKIYPNPASDFLWIHFKDDIEDQAIVELYDPLGRLVLWNRQPGPLIRLELSGVPAGQYFLRVQQGNKKPETRSVFIVAR